ncbi:ferritin-like domain-containing protein [Litorimonas sp. RW-G-Af-16]|uniref:ferritin-like domain-containing protein n=1 Tax=Litorimonas sp. RW-G-Af-16 TaxID=3241168 RepID=UPI00390C71B5
MAHSAISLALQVLQTADPVAKAQAARILRQEWLERGVVGVTVNNIPVMPARPAKPILVAPHDVPRRGIGTAEGRGALLHAIAHIELNAIDLAADMIARFSFDPLLAEEDRGDFITDWTSVCDDEARHFLLLHDRLAELGMTYGDCPAHNGLWDAAQNTANAFTARLAIAPLVLEARGLDVTPGMIKKLTQVGDMDSVAVLEVIYEEEIGHVAIGAKWFQYVARIAGKNPVELFHDQVQTYFTGRVKPPFNVQARTLAGLTEEFYRPLAI